jgi:hypothetical protein
MNRTEILDNIKETYQNWVFHHGQPLEETKRRGEKQQANLSNKKNNECNRNIG